MQTFGEGKIFQVLVPLLLLSRGLSCGLWPGRNVFIMPAGDGENENRNRNKNTPSRGLNRSFFSALLIVGRNADDKTTRVIVV